MNEIQQAINDLAAGKHKEWHVEALKIKEWNEMGWDWPHGESWEFVAGFDYEVDARTALERIEDYVRDAEPYGGTQYQLRLSQAVGEHRRWRD